MADLVALFSELVNNAAEHGMSEQGANAHVRHMPHRRGLAFDVVVVDSGQGIRASLDRNPELPQPDSDAGVIGLCRGRLVNTFAKAYRLTPPNLYKHTAGTKKARQILQ